MQTPTLTFAERLKATQKFIHPFMPVVAGRLTRVVGLTFEAVGLKAPLGCICQVEAFNGNIDAEVVGFSGDRTFLMPITEVSGVMPGAQVQPTRRSGKIAVGMDLLGRVIDSNGYPIDGQGPIKETEMVSLSSEPLNPLARRKISEPLDVGVRAINSVLTIGQGQRMGLFAGSGVGKSVLLGMMTRGTSADVIVVGLVGERGREVKEFIEDILGEEGRRRAVVVAAPADTSPLMRLRGCETAVRIAEYYRDQGLNVLLLVDSITRYAQAQREIALSVGEPPATKGYPPSVFAKLPRLIERAGNGGLNQGSITAFFTVLTEGDDLQDPIADASRAILDGHIALSRDLADAGHYPAIDVGASISRVMPMVISDEHLEHTRKFRQVYGLYEQNRDLINIGAYTKGSDARIDQAIALNPAMNLFLQQRMNESVPYDEGLMALQQISQAIG